MFICKLNLVYKHACKLNSILIVSLFPENFEQRIKNLFFLCSFFREAQVAMNREREAAKELHIQVQKQKQ